MGLDRKPGRTGEVGILNVTILVKTFERPRCLLRLLHSLRRLEIRSPILIADDSAEPYVSAAVSNFPDLAVKGFELPFDSGLSRGRNYLLEKTESPFFLLCDDDFIFDQRTSIDTMARLLRMHDLDLVGGECFDLIPLNVRDAWVHFKRWRWGFFPALLDRHGGRRRRFAGTFQADERGGWIMKPMSVDGELVRCDYVLNFFLARTEVIQKKLGGWTDSLKVGEHEDFFLRAKLAGLRVGFAPGVGVLHLPESDASYLSYRLRAEKMRSGNIRYMS
jgi:GT2 family glycosyltransferase